MDSNIDELINSTAENYSRMLKHLRPCKPGSEFLEQNLITLISHEFLKQNPEGIAFSELPFITPNGNDDWSSRLDAYLATETEGFLVEGKGSQPKDFLFQLIENDLGRIYSKELKTSFTKMATAGERMYQVPKKVSGLIIADCWHASSAKQWNNNHLLKCQFPLLSELSTKSYFVGTYDNYSYYILAGQTKSIW